MRLTRSIDSVLKEFGIGVVLLGTVYFLTRAPSNPHRFLVATVLIVFCLYLTWMIGHTVLELVGKFERDG